MAHVLDLRGSTMPLAEQIKTGIALIMVVPFITAFLMKSKFRELKARWWDTFVSDVTTITGDE
ncbi:MAG TPA: hypothetical protein DEB09_02280 [Candidatus Magasanikbacteria bacterium]|nr:hypothetical protein [Candidatus Magasanikbacteria bacterium]